MGSPSCTEPQQNGPYFLRLSSSTSKSIIITPPNIDDEEQQKDPPYFLRPPMLWLVNESINNYVVWSALVQDQFKRDGVVGFIDGTVSVEAPSKTVQVINLDDEQGGLMDNSDYLRWREESDKPVKERLLTLVDKNVALTDDEQKTCQDIWDEIRKKFDALEAIAETEQTPEESDRLPSEMSKRRIKPMLQRTSTFIKGTSSEYLKLHKSALLGDVWAAKHIFQNDVCVMINNNIIALMRDQLVAHQSPSPNRNNNNRLDKLGFFSEYTAPIYAQRNVLDYLISLYDTDEKSEYLNTARLGLLMSAIDAELFDSAISLLERQTYLAGLKLANKSALTCLASKKSLFRRKPYVEDDSDDDDSNEDDDMDQPAKETTYSTSGSESLQPPSRSILRIAWSYVTKVLKFIGYLFLGLTTCVIAISCIPPAFVVGLGRGTWALLILLGCMEVPEEPRVNLRALDLVKKLCKEMNKLSGTAEEIYGDTVLLAARLGVNLIIEQILSHSPAAALCWDPVSSKHIFHLAVESRDQRLLRIIYDKIFVEKNLHLSLDISDIDGNNMLHLAGKLSPPAVLANIRGSVLEIQHEIKWFKEIEKLMSPRSKEKLNRDGKSPEMVFIEEHRDLKDKAEKWMKDTANSCTIIAALIGTIMFAAAITVPGGNNQDAGFPIFTGNTFFTLFAVSDGISFVTSVTALLMFMEIMMSRYEIEDFRRQLPVRLFIGLGSLLISIMFMMLTFSFTMYLVFGQQHHWVLISIATVTCYIVVLFAYLQGSLILELISSTYRHDFLPNSHSSVPLGADLALRLMDHMV